MTTYKLYPVTIVTDRYSGSYSGEPWLAFHCDADEVPIDAYAGGDCAAMAWWHKPELTVGKGQTPQEALDDLVKRLAEEKP